MTPLFNPLFDGSHFPALDGTIRGDDFDGLLAIPCPHDRAVLASVDERHGQVESGQAPGLRRLIDITDSLALEAGSAIIASRTIAAGADSGVIRHFVFLSS